MTMRTKLTISVIVLMLQSFALAHGDGFWGALNAIFLCVNSWFLGGYIREVTKTKTTIEDIPWTSYVEYDEEDGTHVIEASYYPEEEDTHEPTD